MSWWRAAIGLEPAASAAVGPRASSSAVTEITINSPEELEQALRQGFLSDSGQAVTEQTAMKVATVFACLRIRTGAIANTPLGIKRRVDERTRADATEHPVWALMNRRPNKWQTPSAFKRMLEGHLLLRGHAYAAITKGVGGNILSLIPLHPDRVEKRQLADGSLQFVWTTKDGGREVFAQDEMFHLLGMTLDGVNGVSVLTYARDAIGLSLSMEHHGSSVFKNGANVSGALKLPAGKTLGSKEKADDLRNQFDDFRAGGAREGKVIVLEDGLSFERMALTSEDAQWLAGREFSRTDVCMFFGVPPHLVGITAGNTQLGSSIDSQTQSFVTFNLEDSFVTWEESVGLQLLDWVTHPDLYARFNRNAMVRGDIKTRWGAYVQGMQWGVLSPNDVLAKEDENPRPGGDIYYPPPNMTAKDGSGNGSENDNENENAHVPS